MRYRITSVLLIGGSVLAALAYWSLAVIHQHCLTQALWALQAYADNHDGKLPFSSKGFGDALLLLPQEGLISSNSVLVAPGGNTKVFDDALSELRDVDENQCTRIYVQGLTNQDSGRIAVLFDRHPSRGGDHHRSPWGTFVREVGFVDGTMSVISEADWPNFARQQMKLLADHTTIEQSKAMELFMMSGLPKQTLTGSE